MPVDYVTTVGHTADPLVVSLFDNAAPINLSGITLLELRLVDVHTRLTYVVDLSSSITDAANGAIEHIWSANEFPPPGLYDAQYAIDLQNGRRSYVPNARDGADTYFRFEFLPPAVEDV